MVVTLEILRSFFFVALSEPLVPRIRQSPTARAFLYGINAAAVALMFVVTYQLGRAAVVDIKTFAPALISAVTLFRFRVNSAWLILGGAILGWLLYRRMTLSSNVTSMAHTIIGGLIFLITVGLIMVRPRRVTEAIAAAVGALLMLLCGYVRFGEAVRVVQGQWNVYGFFLGLMMIAALADQAGVFEVITNRPRSRAVIAYGCELLGKISSSSARGHVGYLIDYYVSALPLHLSSESRDGLSSDQCVKTTRGKLQSALFTRASTSFLSFSATCFFLHMCGV